MLAPAKQALKRISETNYLKNIPTRSENLFTPERNGVRKLPLFVNPDYKPQAAGRSICREGALDLNDYLVKNPMDTFLIRVTGDSMIKAGMNSGDILVVDRTVPPANGRIVVASINNELVVKRIRYKGDETYLYPENEKYAPIQIGMEDAFDIWGVVTSVIKTI